MKFNYVELPPIYHPEGVSQKILEHNYFHHLFTMDLTDRLSPLLDYEFLASQKIWEETLENKRHSPLPFPEGRSEYLEGNISLFNDWINILNNRKNYFIELLLNPNYGNARNITSRWCFGIDALKLKVMMATTIVKDDPGYSMAAHLDNEYVVGVLIINLCDNECSTKFFNINDPLEPIFTAPKSRGTGCFFLNTPGSLHSVENTGTRSRFMSYSVLSLIP